jgi:hypothetical protein
VFDGGRGQDRQRRAHPLELIEVGGDIRSVDDADAGAELGRGSVDRFARFLAAREDLVQLLYRAPDSSSDFHGRSLSPEERTKSAIGIPSLIKEGKAIQGMRL